MSVTPLTFTGTTTYSSDFQQILNRAVAIASIPLQQLESEDQTDLGKKTQLISLQSSVSQLTSSLQALGTLGSSQAISATSSDSSVVTVTTNGATSAASYTLNSVTSLATAASETSLLGYTDSTATQVSSTGSLSLMIGTKPYAITLTSQTNNLVGLQNAINQLGAGVTASILTTGNGNYLSLSSNSLGATTLQLFDDPSGANTNLITATNQGTDAVFTLNGLPVTRTQNTVNDLISGATINLQSTSSSPVTISLSSDPSQLSNAIQQFASMYNSVVSQVDAQTGQSAGLLSGDPVVWQLESAMRQISGYQGTGSIKSLADLGVAFNSDGTITFDQSQFNTLSQSQLTSAFQFFGSATSGFGGLSQAMDQISNSVTGAIATEENTLSKADVTLQSQIATTAANINAMQNTLFQQLSQADTAIATLNNQQLEVSASIQSLNYVLYGKSTSTTG